MTITKKRRYPLQKLFVEYRRYPRKEIWIDGVLMNFIYGLLSGLMIAVISLRNDMAVLLSYLLHYFFLGRILNRPKYVSDLGKFIVFPIPTSLGAFVGYKIAPLLVYLLK